MTEENRIRCFIAADLPDAVRTELAALIASLKKHGTGFKWVASQNLHLTLRFLGYLNEQKVGEVVALLKALCSSAAPFQMSLAGLGAFPDLKHPHVVWVGVQKGREAIESLAAKLEACLLERGFDQAENPFSARLTLGRIKAAKNSKEFIEELSGVSYVSSHENLLEHLAFYRSILTAEGPRYELIEKIWLKGPAGV